MRRSVRLLLSALGGAAVGVIALTVVVLLLRGLAHSLLDAPWPAWVGPVTLASGALAGLLMAWRGGRSVWLALPTA